VTSPGASSAFAAFRYRDFRIWWVGFIVQNHATVMQTLGLGWLAVEQAERDGGDGRVALYLALVGLARAVPAIALGLFGGVVSDRFDRRSVLVWTQLIFGLATIGLAALALAGASHILAILATAAVISAAAAFYVPARQAIQPRIVGEENLMSAFGFNVAALNASALAGPLVGGLIIAVWSVGGLLLVSGLAWALVGLSLTRIAPQPMIGAGPQTNVLASLGEGLRFIGRDVTLTWLLIAYLVAMILVRPISDLLPGFTNDILGRGPVELSWLLTAWGLGAFASGFVTASMGRFHRRALIALAGFATAGVIIGLFSIQRDLGPAIVLSGIAGFLIMLSSGIVGVTIQISTPDQFRGRVIAAQSLLIEGGAPTGVLLLGAIGSVLGIDVALGIGGVGLVIASLAIVARVPLLRQAQRDRVPQPAPEVA
jgi:predicted MFS family arabinose efflux permease